jgi:tetratricopeptide (TPR) repeat protein
MNLDEAQGAAHDTEQGATPTRRSKNGSVRSKNGSAEWALLQEILAQAPVELATPRLDRISSQVDGWTAEKANAYLERLAAFEADQAQACPSEYKIARIWINLALPLAAEVGSGFKDCLSTGWEAELAELGRVQGSRLWQPAQAWLYRSLVWAERRELLAQILPNQGPFTLPQADAWLEAAALPGSGLAVEQQQLRQPQEQSGAYPAVIAQPWWELIRLESMMAESANTPPVMNASEIEERLVDLSHRIQEAVLQQPADTWTARELRRLGGKTLAALVRARLAMYGSDGGLFLSPAAAWMVKWEHAYLQGLAAWQRKDYGPAETSLFEALQENPNSDAVRYALAVFIVERNPGQKSGRGVCLNLEETALELLETCSPTRPVHVARASLLARLGRYPEAEAELDAGQNAAICDSTRYLWPRAFEQVQRQEALLRTALAERAGDSSQAMIAWRKACSTGGAESFPRGPLAEARPAFSAWVELNQQQDENSAWRRRLVQQRLEKGRQELAKINARNPDILFFRAAVFVDFEPELAARDIRVLLQRRTWIDQELRAGGNRILWLADAALKLGQVELAQHAYNLLERSSCLSVTCSARSCSCSAESPQAITDPDELLQKRRTLTSLYQAVVTELLVLREEQNFEVSKPMFISLARQAGVEEDTCQALDSLAAGRIDPELSLEQLQRFPEAVRPLFVFYCGRNSEEERAHTFLEWTGGAWTSLAPVDPGWIASRVVLEAIKKQQYDHALSWLKTNLGSMGNERSRSCSAQWALELQAWIHLHQALWLGRQGELDSAEKELDRVETTLRMKAAIGVRKD